MTDNTAQIHSNHQAIQKLQEEIEKLRDTEALQSTMKDHNSSQDSLAHTFKQCKLLQGHFGKIYAMDWGADEDTVLSAAQDGSLILWNAYTNNKIDVISLRSSWVMSCAMSQNGRMTASGGLDNIVTIYKIPEEPADETEKKSHAELMEHTGYISGAAFLPDNQTVISSSGDSTCILWDIEKKAHVSVFKGHASDVMDVALIPNTNQFVSGSCDMKCKVWDHRDSKADVLTFPGHESDINTVDTAGCGNAFISGGDDSAILLHDLRSYGPLQSYRETTIISSVTAIALSNSARMIFSGWDDIYVRCWDTLTGEMLPGGQLDGHTSRVSCLGVNKQGSALCTGGWDQILRIWA